MTFAELVAKRNEKHLAALRDVKAALDNLIEVVDATDLPYDTTAYGASRAAQEVACLASVACGSKTAELEAAQGDAA